jgi:hypothetical protein
MRTPLVRLMQIAVVIVGLSGFGSARAAGDRIMLECHMKYSVTSWNVDKKMGSGVGKIHCSDGENIQVRVRVWGEGITGGKSVIGSALGSFSPAIRLSDLLGAYTAGEGKSGGGQVMTKPSATMTLGGNELNITFSEFEIYRARTRSS